MPTIRRAASIALVLLACAVAARAQTAPEPANPKYDPKLAQSTGADEIGMRGYVLVILKTGKRVPDGPERDEMFKGHFANINRLASEGKLVVAGPLDGVDGWRGLFVFATPDIEEAKKLVATDPVVVKGEMVPELHKWYGTSAMMLIPELHEKVAKKR
ncbi:MAG: YciI family protein [Burkholderiales bacterium]